MSEISSGTIKEICDAVCKDVLDEVKESLSQMKPHIVQEIVEEVTEREKNAYKVQKQKYIERLDRLEKTLEKLEKRIQKLEMNKPDNKKSVSSSDSSRRADTQVPRINMSRRDIALFGFKYNGWVYYSNEEMGEFLYKVKLDGTCNTQLTDFSSSVHSARVEGGYLYFEDGKYSERKIKID